MAKGKEIILYVGGFQLPDKNAAALRVINNAKAFRELGYTVIFLNALEDYEYGESEWTSYDGFKTWNYRRESQWKYLLCCKTIISMIRKTEAGIVITYNYPSVALNRLRIYCQDQRIKCIADITEWYMPYGNPIYKLIKSLDTLFRMRYVHPRMDAAIVISEYLYQFYKCKVKTVKIPPLVDLNEEKWKVYTKKKSDCVKFIYAGSPSVQKERLDLIIQEVESLKINIKVHLDVLGITKEQFNKIYRQKYCGGRVSFHGRVSNDIAVSMIRNSDWAVVLRDKNRVVQAGFPTKISEAIACGTPVIANNFSNIEDYLNEENSILIETVYEFKNALLKAISSKKTFSNKVFDYREYIDEFKRWLE